MPKVTVLITTERATATVTYTYAKYATQGAWQAEGDENLVEWLEFYARLPMGYTIHGYNTDDSKSFENIYTAARRVANLYGGKADYVGDIVMPPIDNVEGRIY